MPGNSSKLTDHSSSARTQSDRLPAPTLHIALTRCGDLDERAPMGRNAKIDATIGGYIRLHKRRLCTANATASTCYELVRPAPTADKPWQKRIFSLGSLKVPVQDEDDLIRFWQTALFRMRRHGLDTHQCRRAACEMMRKGAQAPTGRATLSFRSIH
jgi:hypothetical protein